MDLFHSLSSGNAYGTKQIRTVGMHTAGEVNPLFNTRETLSTLNSIDIAYTHSHPRLSTARW
jgi:hypothetical protein